MSAHGLALSTKGCEAGAAGVVHVCGTTGWELTAPRAAATRSLSVWSRAHARRPQRRAGDDGGAATRCGQADASIPRARHRDRARRVRRREEPGRRRGLGRRTRREHGRKRRHGWRGRPHQRRDRWKRGRKRWRRWLRSTRRRRRMRCLRARATTPPRERRRARAHVRGPVDGAPRSLRFRSPRPAWPPPRALRTPRGSRPGTRRPTAPGPLQR
jgi:hypothetical protein